MTRTVWPPRYLWLREYALAKPDAVEDYKESWDALRYFVRGKMFALLVRNRGATLLNLKCEPYLSLDFRVRYPTVLPGWHMNKLHWISLSLMGNTPESVCRELVDISYDLVWKGLPKKIREARSPIDVMEMDGATQLQKRISQQEHKQIRLKEYF